jgi:nitrite reductase/ring-hydroxylating ferredoxin subunit
LDSATEVSVFQACPVSALPPGEAVRIEVRTYPVLVDDGMIYVDADVQEIA